MDGREVRFDMLARPLPPAPDLASSPRRPAPARPQEPVLRAAQSFGAEPDDPWGFRGPIFGR